MGRAKGSADCLPSPGFQSGRIPVSRNAEVLSFEVDELVYFLSFISLGLSHSGDCAAELRRST